MDLSKQRLRADILGCSLEDSFGRVLDQAQEQDYANKIALLKQGYPLDYLLSQVEIDGYKFQLNPSVLIPRPETGEWLKFLIKELDLTNLQAFRNSGKLLEIGTGSGYISILLNSHFAQILATDVSAKALLTAKQNIVLNKLGNIDLLQADLLSSPKIKSFLDSETILLANLPYVPIYDRVEARQNKVNFEPEIAIYSGLEGLDLFSKLIIQLSELEIDRRPLEIWLELDPRNIHKAQKAIIQTFGDYYQTQIWSDYNNWDRVLRCYKYS